ncbi:pre-tRNA nuclear export protein [Scheffersomyces spartinae]|uniref:Exportin-T n=1 Tax=Scheffersomyces spartinae TaxID=45513 RepID=A0A9P7V7A6_9ASCO|nr:pre-tRNA nuclear export protein [Scheffersomyces spartinae]KAG7192589.1 pre-tRNA nuclear export protein [Scheffersomyces spartinae]
MEQQILQAVEIALSGTSDVALKNQAIEFVNNIKSTPEGYKSCVDILLKSVEGNSIGLSGAVLSGSGADSGADSGAGAGGSSVAASSGKNNTNGDATTKHQLDDNLKFFIYQVIDEYMDKLNSEELFGLNESLFKVLGFYVEKGIQDATYLKNKFSALFGQLFCRVYLNVYPNFLNHWLKLFATGNMIAADYYIRVLICIHLEIADRLISRSREIQERSNLLKDAIREEDMNSLVTSWSTILVNPSNYTPEIINNTIKVIGQYIDWMDISLFVGNDFLNSLFQYLSVVQQRRETSLTLVEITSKKMKPLAKLELISLLNLTSIIDSINLADVDVEFAEALAKLANQVGIELIYVLENDSSLVEQVRVQLFKLWPSIFRFLEHEYDDVSIQVFHFIQTFLLAWKKQQHLNDVDLLSSLLNKIIMKMKFDDDDDGDDEDTIEQFNDVRVKLKTMQDTITILKPELFLEAIPLVIQESIFKSKDPQDWRKLELGLYELNNFSDSLKNNHINVPKTQINSSKPYLIFQEYLIQLINSDFILNVSHPLIQTAFFELIVRHYNFLVSTNHQLTFRILNVFASPLGLYNSNDTVRLRCWYLFQRFLKLTRPSISEAAFLDELVIKLQPLLEIKPEMPEPADSDEELELNSNFKNQLYIFESIGLIIMLSSIDNALKLKLIDLVFQPLFNTLESCIQRKDSAASPEELQLLALQVSHSLMAISIFANGCIAESVTKYSPEIVDRFNSASTVVLISLENFSKFESVREASRSAFARFIPILNGLIRNHLSKLISLILAAGNLKIAELNDFLPFLGQIVHKYQKDESIYQLLNNSMTPVIDKVFQMLSERENELIPDLVRSKNLLKRSLMNFFSNLTINHSLSLIVTETNKQKLPLVVNSFIEFSYELNDTTVSKLAITQLINMVTVFGKDDKINDSLDQFGQALPPVEGISEFLMNKVIQLAFELPFQNQQFNIKDAQYRLVAQEISLLLKTYYQIKGDEFLANLSNYLTTMGLSQELMNDFGTNLVSLDQRQFKKYFVSFVTELKK